MSMLTEQTKKLRKAAYEVERIKNDTIGMPTHDVLTLADTAMQLRHAADTIAALRNRLTEQTCHRTRGKFEEFDYCSECGGMLARWIERDGSVPCYCPSCGRRVVE